MHLLILVVLFVLVAVALIASTVMSQFSTTKRLARKAARLNARSWSAVEAGILALGVPTALKTASASLKDKLKDIETEKAELRDERVEAQTELDSAASAYASSTEPLSKDSKEFQEAKAAQGKVGEIDDRLAELDAMHIDTLKMLGKDAPRQGGQDRAAGIGSDPRGERWDSSHIFADETLAAQLQHMSGSKARSGPVRLGEVASRDALVADVTGSADMRRSTYLGILPQLRRQLRVLDLLPTSPMDGNSIPYTQESGSLDTAGETAEGAPKPEGAWAPTDQTADAKTIAHWLKIRKQVLADFPALQGIIDNRLRYGVERRLENQILAGDGSGENILGILNTTGVGAIAYDASELAADQVLVGITSILLADGQADGIVMHPTDWANVIKAKASGDGHYFSAGPFSMTPQVMWGVPLVPSKAIPQGSALVADFAIGAQLFIREGVSVLLSDSDQDDFIKNKVTMLAELRAALAVWRPPVFTKVALA